MGELSEAGAGEIGGVEPREMRALNNVQRRVLDGPERRYESELGEHPDVGIEVIGAADPPKLTAAKQEDIKTWTAEELGAFLGEIRDHRLYPAFHLSSHTGMRRGEILGLRWSDIDFDEARLAVRQALISVAYEMQLSDVKTDTGRRTIDLDEGTVAVLRRWKKGTAGAQRRLRGRRV